MWKRDAGEKAEEDNWENLLQRFMMIWANSSGILNKRVTESHFKQRVNNKLQGVEWLQPLSFHQQPDKINPRKNDLMWEWSIFQLVFPLFIHLGNANKKRTTTRRFCSFLFWSYFRTFRDNLFHFVYIIIDCFINWSK